MTVPELLIPFASWAGVKAETAKKVGTVRISVLAAALARTQYVAQKEAASLISFFALRDPKGGRRTENIAACHAVVGDIDGGFERGAFERALDELAAAGSHVIAHETFRSAPDSPRWRVFAFLDQPVPPEEYRTLWHGLNDVFGGVLDPNAKDASRINYVPSCPPGQQREFRYLAPGGMK